MTTTAAPGTLGPAYESNNLSIARASAAETSVTSVTAVSVLRVAQPATVSRAATTAVPVRAERRRGRYMLARQPTAAHEANDRVNMVLSPNGGVAPAVT